MSVFADVSRCSLLHEGGEAQIYRIWSGSKSYVLKWYASGCHFDENTADCLERERIEGVYHILEKGQKKNRYYLVYDYVEGLNASDLSPMPVSVALHVMRKLVSTLKRLSARGIHHGDLSPANVVMGPDGQMTFIDCGIVGLGALAYAAPERFQGKPASEKSDAYSLAGLLYFLITGENLIEAQSYEGFAKAASEIDSLDVTAKLYAVMDRVSVGSLVPQVEAFAKLELLWKTLLRSDPKNRVEDLDELDELLEIAFDAVSGGEVSWVTTRSKFIAGVVRKIGTNGDGNLENCEIPQDFAIAKPSNRNKKFLLVALFGLILLGIVLAIALGSKSVNVDETGSLMMQKSKSLYMNDLVDDSEGGQDSILNGIDGQILKAQPVPDLGDGNIP